MGRRNKGLPINGWINFNKPEDMTSTQAVGKIRYLLNAKKAGHAGTLDPLATGVLPIALGEATKTIAYAHDALKEYSFKILFGQSTSTDDAEGDVTETSDYRPTLDEINTALPDFIGHIEQTPPKFSAIKINGQRAYDLARDGKDVELKPRPAYIKDIKVLDYDGESVTLHVTSGKGVYMRSLGRDIALKCQSVGHLSELRRLRVGVFDVDDAISLDKCEELSHNNQLETALLPLDSVLDDIPALSLKEAEAVRLKNGNRLSFVSRPDVERIKALDLDIANQNDPVIALARFEDLPLGLVQIKGIDIQPIKIFNL